MQWPKRGDLEDVTDGAKGFTAENAKSAEEEPTIFSALSASSAVSSVRTITP